MQGENLIMSKILHCDVVYFASLDVLTSSRLKKIKTPVHSSTI